ncbi:MAG: oxidoreductase [Flaviaesturariibacter sp.]|nr:oxidoreductase [Flaviaesturariibacter sp.]
MRLHHAVLLPTKWQMKIGVLGTGSVGQAIATALVKAGHSVMMGSRTAGNEKAVSWQASQPTNAEIGNFDDTAAYGELLFFCLNGSFALEAAAQIAQEHVTGKAVIDTTNPLDFSGGMPPGILEAYRNVSLGEQLQAALPGARIVKALNTLNYKVMVDARVVNGGDHTLYLCGNDVTAKETIKDLLADNFYWTRTNLVDLGDISAARGMEAIVPFWVQVMQSLHTPLFNFKVVH